MHGAGRSNGTDEKKAGWQDSKELKEFVVFAVGVFFELGEAFVFEGTVGEEGGSAGNGGGDFFDGGSALRALGERFFGHGLELLEGIFAEKAGFTGRGFVEVDGHGRFLSIK